MSLFNFKKKRTREEKTTEEQPMMSESDSAILSDAVENGVPCIPFIPIDALRESLSILKPEGLKGYFVARIPALYADGSIKYLFKEEFMLWNVVNNLVRSTESKGRSYFFMGFERPMTTYDETPNRYLSPQVFYQNNYTLFRLETSEKIESFPSTHAPSLELTYFPADHNIRFAHIHVVDFLLVAHLYPPNEREDPSGFIMSLDQWEALQYPLSGKGLQALFANHIRGLKASLA